MKKFSLLALFSILTASLFIISSDKEVDAGAGQNVSGWAWSENIGWISFNSTNCDTANPLGQSDGGAGCPAASTPMESYGVSMDNNGKLSGYAWSENIGWITFDKEVAGIPPGAPYNGGQSFMAKKNGNNFEGWARALSASSTNSGGWDGWIKLRKDSGDAGADYGVSLLGDDFVGWAWGGGDSGGGAGVIGWISFNCNNPELPAPRCADSNYKVVLKGEPTAANLSVTPPNAADYCGITGYPPVRLNYTFMDPGDSQSAYQIEIDDTSNFSSPVATTSKISSVIASSSTQSVVVMAPSPFSRTLSWNSPYYWRVRVWDSANNTSTWVSTASFTTAPHAYPYIDLTSSPQNPGAGEVVTFNDDSTCYLTGGGSNSCKNSGAASYLWNFGNNATSSFKGNATTSYAQLGQYTAALSITDDTGTCSGSRQVKVSNPFEWKEIIPF